MYARAVFTVPLIGLILVIAITVVKTDKPCCTDLTSAVMQAAKSSHLPVPIQAATIFIDAEDVGE